jgi:hypothetical protein
LLKTLSESFDGAQACTEFIEVTNGRDWIFLADFPFMLRLLEAFLISFQQPVNA